MLIRALPDWAATVRLAGALAGALRPGDGVFLRGNLGSGKTALAGAIIQAFGYEGLVKSPTYTLIEEYDLRDLRVIHADLYRLTQPEELEALGWWDYLDARTLTLVEWPERARGVLKADVDVCLVVTDHEREARLRALSRRGTEVLDSLKP
ncbi:MAG TPA: tRNA (adenosine(37)-N6)-threonylcarbamoyltransferase complex ATPase subunit type 1 TsaE [Acidiferrobacter sp.]|nr:tRNA (adenosine(37)-N6)-threonylcarbamoyltransferase complex ATPase subunit type 1 TsaE [Acidiferrobacter sp.]